MFIKDDCLFIYRELLDQIHQRFKEHTKETEVYETGETKLALFSLMAAISLDENLKSRCHVSVETVDKALKWSKRSLVVNFCNLTKKTCKKTKMPSVLSTPIHSFIPVHV